MKKIISLLFMLFFSFGIFAITDKQKSDLLFMYQEEKRFWCKNVFCVI